MRCVLIRVSAVVFQYTCHFPRFFVLFLIKLDSFLSSTQEGISVIYFLDPIFHLSRIQDVLVFVLTLPDVDTYTFFIITDLK